jgi:hypothetical protein
VPKKRSLSEESHGTGSEAAHAVPDEYLSELQLRLTSVLEGKSHEAVAAWSGISAESVRRYLHGHAPTAKFLASVCIHENVNADWLLMGIGCRRREDLIPDALLQAALPSLLSEIGRRLEQAGNVDVSRGKAACVPPVSRDYARQYPDDQSGSQADEIRRHVQHDEHLAKTDGFHERWR